MGEFLVSKKGLGYLIIYGTQVFNLNIVMSGIFILVIISFVLYGEHSGNISHITLEKIAKAMNLTYPKLKEQVRQYNNHDINTKHTYLMKTENPKIYSLFELINTFNDEDIDMLHTIASKFKK